MIAAVYWTCLTCTTVGSTDRTAEQHTKTTGHPCMTGTDPDALARMRDERAPIAAARVREVEGA